MNPNTDTKKIVKSFLVIALFAFAVTSFAEWASPSVAPTGGNTPSPINVGNDAQWKVGGLFVGGFRSTGYGIIDANLEVGGTVKIAGGNPAQDKVLASDVAGLASWKTLAELGGGGGGGSGTEGNGWTDDGSTVRLTDPSDNIRIGPNTVIYKGINNPSNPPIRFMHGSSSNIFLGPNAGNLSLTSGGLTGIGADALKNITNGIGNTALGYNSLENTTSGNNNTGIGTEAMSANTTGTDNVAVGKNSLGSNTTGSNNTVVGSEAMSSNVSGKENTAIGYQALQYGKGNWNTAVGRYAQSVNGNYFGSYNTSLGHNAGTTAPTGEESYSNTTAIGAGATVDASNKVKIGNPLVAWIGGQVPWSPASDFRFKKDILDSDLGLEFINSLRPVSYQMKTDTDDRRSYGFIAQEVEKSLGDRKTKLIDTENTPEAYKYLRYNDIIPILTKAVQEQQIQIEELKKEIELLKNK